MLKETHHERHEEHEEMNHLNNHVHGFKAVVGRISDSASTIVLAQWWMRAVIVPYNLTALIPSMEDAKRRLIPLTKNCQ